MKRQQIMFFFVSLDLFVIFFCVRFQNDGEYIFLNKIFIVLGSYNWKQDCAGAEVSVPQLNQPAHCSSHALRKCVLPFASTGSDRFCSCVLLLLVIYYFSDCRLLLACLTKSVMFDFYVKNNTCNKLSSKNLGFNEFANL